jgi:hypothetical protein
MLLQHRRVEERGRDEEPPTQPGPLEQRQRDIVVVALAFVENRDQWWLAAMPRSAGE